MRQCHPNKPLPYRLLLAAFAIGGAGVASAEVVELDGEGLVDTYVQGISIGQVVKDKKFASDDQDQRDAATDRQNAQGVLSPEIAVSNAEALQQRPKLNELIPETLAAMDDSPVRDLAEDALVDTGILQQGVLSDRLDVNFNRLADYNIGTPNPATDITVLQGTLLELLPSTTGYQFEFMKDR